MNWEFRYIMATSFTENEAELLANAAEHYFGMTDGGTKPVVVTAPLILDVLKDFEDEGRGME